MYQQQGSDYMPKARKDENFIGYMFQEIEDAICELDESIEERTGALEDIICEMDMANGGANYDNV